MQWAKSHTVKVGIILVLSIKVWCFNLAVREDERTKLKMGGGKTSPHSLAHSEPISGKTAQFSIQKDSEFSILD